MANVLSLPPTEKNATEAISAFTNCINTPTLLDLAVRFSGIYSNLAKTSLDQFLVTPVTALPTGREQGKFICIDVGGTNLRVGFIELLGEGQDGGHEGNGQEKTWGRIRRSYDKSWPIGNHLKIDHAEDLFEWIGGCMAEVIRAALDDMPEGAIRSPFGEELLLGITFSFPMAQKSLSEATLLPMGKGFAITSNLNLGKLLLAGYSRYAAEPHAVGKNGTQFQLPRIRIAAITNDTVATFTSLAYAVKAATNSRVAMGLIVGTGTNATVPMKLANLHAAKKDDLQNPEDVETVVINTEWTIKGTEPPLVDLGIQNHWDRALDRNSDRPGFQPFEYMTAGRYLGEIVRLVFIDQCNSETESPLPRGLENKDAISTKFLSEVIARTHDNATLGEKLEAEYPSTGAQGGMPFWTTRHVMILRDIATAVQQRSSALIAAACVGLLDCVHDIRIDRPGQAKQNGHVGTVENTDTEELVIAYAGSIISQYPNWLADCQKWINILVAEGSVANTGKRVLLKEASDGGIIGAGVLAGMTECIA